MRSAAALFLAVLLSACTGSTSTKDEPAVENTIPTRAGKHDVPCSELDQFVERVRRGYVPVRSSDIALIPHEPTYIGTPDAAVHTGPYDFLAEVPLVVYGPGHVQPTGAVDESPTMADVAPTIARLIGFSDFDAPDGEALTTGMPASGSPPRVVVTVVWDGGGWNTLREHPRSWPFLARLIERGVSFEGMEIGSTPSVTPPIHTTLGTGAFPRRHGIPNVKMTTADDRYINPMELNSPEYIKIPTLGDVYDVAEGNRPLVGVVATVNWHLGMIGKGTLHPGGDADLAGLFRSDGTTYGVTDYYEIPFDLNGEAELAAAAGDLDAEDGARDETWRGHPLDDEAVRYASPAYVHWFGERLRAAITTRGFGSDRVPDLLFTNFKSIDDAGHRWGMVSPETGADIAATDAELKKLVEHLDAEVGAGEWVVIVTADHGTSKFPEQSGGWAVRGHDLREDLNRAFDLDEEPLFERVNSAGIFLNDEAVERSGVDLREVGDWLLDYTANDNLYEIDEVPAYYAKKADIPLFDAVVAGRKVVARSCRTG